jgi:hypothetical protein
MTKRPSIIAGMDLTPPAQAQSDKVIIPAPQAAPAKPRAVRRDVQHTSVYIPRPAYERLREIAFAERRKIHELLMQGIDRVIAERGHPERATRSTAALQGRRDTTE